MKRFKTPILILAALALVAGAGYFGSNSASKGQAQASAGPQAPPTVAVSRGDVQQTVVAPGQLAETKEVVLSLDVGGRLVELNARPGEVVRQGDVLARLDTAPFEDALAQAQLRLEQAQAEHARQLAQAQQALETARLRLEQAQAEHPRKLAEAELALQSAQARLAQAQLQYPGLTTAQIRLRNALEVEAEAQVEYQEALERQQANWEPEEVAEGYLRALEAAQDARAIAQAEYDAARGAQAAADEQFKNLQTDIERAKIELERLESGVDPLLALEVEDAQRALADLQDAGVDPFLELAVRQAQADLQAANLLAPWDGVALEIRARPGESVGAGTGLLVLADPSAVEARSTVIEEDLPLVQVGQAVELFFDAIPEANVQGRVARIVPQRVAGEGRPLYYVYIVLEDSPRDLLPGMTVDASIIIAQRTDVLRLPRALVRARADGTAQVQVWQDGQEQTRTVQVGLRGDVYVEILAGLEQGDLVVGK